MSNVSHISDQSFFGEWDALCGKWKTESKLNYSYSKDLSAVEDLVKKQDYTQAKEELLRYYRQRSSIPKADIDGGIKECIFLNFKNMSTT